MNDEMLKEQSFSDLYEYFCGMMVRREADDLYGWMFGAIPDVCSVKGDIHLADQDIFSESQRKRAGSEF